MLVSGQTPDVPGSIKLVECQECADIVLKLPEVSYPSYLGYGAHKAEGQVGIQIVINEKGDVESARAIYGHPYFRPMLEKASLTAKFKPTVVDGKAVAKKAIISYQITLPQYVEETAKFRSELGIINGLAIELHKPEYTQAAKDLCASGQVKVEVELSDAGKVIKAIPFSGDEVLFEAARIAAFESSFRPTQHVAIRSKGIVVYDFALKTKCLQAGNVFGRWLTEPNFSIHPHSIVQEEHEILVHIGINVFSGKVVAAKAVGGHPLNRTVLEAEAMKITFRPAMITAPSFNVRGFIRLRIKPDRSVEPFK